MALKNTIKALSATRVDSSTFNNTLQLLSLSTGLPFPCSILRITNDCALTVGISYDGVNISDVVLPTSTLELNFQSNAQPGSYAATIAKGTVIYIIGAAASTGFVYMAGYYQPEGY